VQQLLDDALARERLAAALATLFGAVALVLAAIGAYGLLSHITARRTHEIGVRMALGARAEDAVWLVLRQALGMAAVGIAIGIPLALGVARLIRSQLHGVAAGDPRVMIGSAAVLLLVGILASLIPGRRAARVDPMVALRNE
jgi:putative ABC transport system permease protein